MKLELKTENDHYSNSFSYFFCVVFIFTLIIVLCDIAVKIGTISRQYSIEYNCRILRVEKSTANFKKLSRLSNLKSKDRIWEFCREVVK